MNRRHDIDALRVLAFALLILYHTAMAYVGDWGFHLKGSFTTDALQWPMRLVNGWRMSLLFLISGVAIALVRPRMQRDRFVLVRSWRLLLPLLFGMLVVVPIQPYCEGVSRGTVTPGFWEFLLRYWQVRPWPEGSFAGARFGITWNHLWYLAYLWTYTVVLVLVMPLLDGTPMRRFSQWLSAAPAVILIGMPALVLLLWMAWLAPSHPATNTFVDDFYQHAKYGSVFLAGYLLGREPRFWQRVQDLRWASLLAATGALAWYLFLEALGRWLPGDSPLRQWPERFWGLQSQYCEVLYVWAMLMTVLGWGKRYLDRPFPWLPYCTEAVYPWYVLHQSLLIGLLFWLKPLHLAPWLEPMLLLSGTIAGCLLLHEGVIRRSRWLRPLFGLKLGSPRRGAANAARSSLPAANARCDGR